MITMPAVRPAAVTPETDVVFAADRLPGEFGMRRTQGGMVIATTREFGVAARKNRRRYSGTMIHKLLCEYVVGLKAGVIVQPGTYGYNALTSGKPVIYACQPACGCTQGQQAGSPSPSRTAADVTCTKCGVPAVAAAAA